MDGVRSTSERMRNFLDNTYSVDKLLKLVSPCLLLTERLTGFGALGRWRNLCSLGRGVVAIPLVYRFWRVALLGDPRQHRLEAGMTPTAEQSERMGQATAAIGPSDRVLCFLLGLIAAGRFVSLLNNRAIKEIDLGKYQSTFGYGMVCVGTFTSCWGVRHNLLEKEYIDSLRGFVRESETKKQEVGLVCGVIQCSGELPDNVLRLFGHDTTPQLGLLIVAAAAQVRARWEKS